MCKFFSCVSNGKGKVFYLDAEQRKEVKETDIKSDSHSSIVEYYKRTGELSMKPDTEDKFNKYEYNPMLAKFTIDQLNTADGSEAVEKFCRKLDFKTVVPELVIKPIIDPFVDKLRKKVTQKDIARLKQWASVYDSMRASVRISVRDSVGISAWNSICNSVYDSVCNSVRTSAWAYISSFFILDKWQGIDHEPGINPFQCCIDLWESGLVPSFDGKKWRLHGYQGKILFEINKKELEK